MSVRAGRSSIASLAAASEHSAASTSSPPPRRRHARTAALNSSLNGSLASLSSLTAPMPSAPAPLALDPMAVGDADVVLERMGVREATAWAERVGTAHAALQQDLRSLVSERYRDMLTTADTIISMGASSASLVAHLSAVHAGADSAAPAPRGASSRHEHGERAEERQAAQLVRMAASLRLVQEAPGVLWEAIAPAGDAATSAAPRSEGQKPGAVEPAALLRASWLARLADAAWRACQEMDADVQRLFPYVAAQHEALAPLRLRISALVSSALERVGTYSETVTLLLCSSLLAADDGSQPLALLLRCRQDGISKALAAQSTTSPLSAALRAYSSTLSHARRAFTSSAPETPSHFAELLGVLALPDPAADGSLSTASPAASRSPRNSRRKSSYGFSAPSSAATRPSFPPSAMAALQTMPSAALVAHLPASVRGHVVAASPAPSSSAEEQIAAWAEATRAASLARIDTLVQRLDTVSALGHAQAAVQSADKTARHEVRALAGERERFTRNECAAFADVLLERLAQQSLRVVEAQVGRVVTAVELGARTAASQPTAETAPLSFLFESPAESSQPRASSSATSLSLRLAQRTESLDASLAAIESAAVAAGADVTAYARRAHRQRREGKTADATPSAHEALRSDIVARMTAKLLGALEALLAETLRSDAAREERARSFGRLVAGLAASHKFRHALWAPSTDTDTFVSVQSALLDIYRRSMAPWLAEAARAAVVVEAGVASPPSEDPPRASESLLRALSSLARRVHAGGISWSSADLTKDALNAFVREWLAAGDVQASDAQLLHTLLAASGLDTAPLDKMAPASGRDELSERSRREQLAGLRLELAPFLPADFARELSSAGDEAARASAASEASSLLRLAQLPNELPTPQLVPAEAAMQ